MAVACQSKMSRALVQQPKFVRSTPVPSRVPSGARLVLANASMKESFDYVAQAFAKIFSPPEDNGVNWSGTMRPLSGSFHPERKAPREPVVPAVTGCTDPSAENFNPRAQLDDGSCELPDRPVEAGQSGAADYVAGAVDRVISHNFVGDENEPNWGNNEGWSGDVPKRTRDGFHSRVL